MLHGVLTPITGKEKKTASHSQENCILNFALYSWKKYIAFSLVLKHFGIYSIFETEYIQTCFVI
jgi:hypothetical protein